jgi:hypothetical protein
LPGSLLPAARREIAGCEDEGNIEEKIEVAVEGD